MSAVPLQKCPLACKLWVRLKSEWYGQGGPKMQISELNIRVYKLQILEFRHRSSRSRDGPFYEIFLRFAPTHHISWIWTLWKYGKCSLNGKLGSKAIIGEVESVPNLMLWSSTFYTRFVHYLVKFMVVHTNSVFHKHVISKTFSDVVRGARTILPASGVFKRDRLWTITVLKKPHQYLLLLWVSVRHCQTSTPPFDFDIGT